MSHRLTRRLYVFPLTALLACTSTSAPPAGPAEKPIEDSGVISDPGQKVSVAPSDVDQAAFQALLKQVESVEKLDPAGLRAAYPAPFQSKVSYAPGAAEFLDRIQASPLALSDGELAALEKNGFVISTRREFPTFLRGLSEIYSSHLPLYVSADALLEAVHSSYDQILMTLELGALAKELSKLLTGMRARLATTAPTEEARADADLYLAVALSLLQGKRVEPVAGAAPAKIADIVQKAEDAKGEVKLSLFGVTRDEDFSQFTPRGHYTRDEGFRRYFRAMIWLGRVDLRLLETLSDGSQVFRRPPYRAMLLLHELVGPDLPTFQLIDKSIRTFVGESDYMVLDEVASLVKDLGGPEQAKSASDDDVARAIVAGDYGKQQIASHLMVNDGSVPTLPLNRSFALLGQRYVVDSHVFSEVVYDRLKAKRMMPSPLDAAFAALGNSQALALHPDLEKFEKALPGALGRMRVLVDAHEPQFWEANLYNLWLGALRGLSPTGKPADAALPQVMATEAWGRRLLNAQLGSWAELRHDTVLYAKQSYTGVPACDFPDAYVDPYPAFWKALAKYAQAGMAVSEFAVEPFGSMIGDYFQNLHKAVTILGEMAERELRGEPFSEEQLAFINNAVRVETIKGCATVEVPDGWYAELFFDPNKSIEFDPTIADVHTQPSDEGGKSVGKVLHVGTSYPRFMVTTVDSCQASPRAYAGVVYAYHELTTNNFERLTDEKWAERLSSGSEPRPADVPWLAPVLAK